MDAILGTIWEYIIIAIPTILAIIGEIIVNKLTTKAVSNLKNEKSAEEQALRTENAALRKEIRQMNKSIAVLTTKIDRIYRPEIDEEV